MLRPVFRIALAFLLLAPPFSGRAHAAVTFTVDSTADDGDAVVGDGACATTNDVCTLRAAVEEANTIVSASVELPAGTYTVGAPLSITSTQLAVVGADRATTVIQGGGFSVTPPEGCVPPYAGLSLESVTVASGGVTGRGCLVQVAVTDAKIGPGGGIVTTGFMAALTVTDSEVSGNTTGGIQAGRAFTQLVRTLVQDNSSPGDGAGLLATHSDSRVHITDSIFRDNLSAGNGGGIFARIVSVTGSLIEDNEAAGYGGGIQVGPSGGLTLTNSVVRANKATTGGGASIGLGDASITGSTIADTRQ